MDKYRIKNIDDSEKVDEILKIYYGNIWVSVFDRLPIDVDGYIMSIFHKGKKLKVYNREFAQFK